jgi:hypothetical protein
LPHVAALVAVQAGALVEEKGEAGEGDSLLDMAAVDLVSCIAAGEDRKCGTCTAASVISVLSILAAQVAMTLVRW